VDSVHTESERSEESVAHTDEALEALTSEESAELLRTHRMGRLVFAFESWPVVLPVNYAFDDPTVVIRTDLGAKLSAAPLHAVAFEIDDADPSGAWGWSVLAQGPAFDITSAQDARSEQLRSLAVEPWAPGVHDHWLMMSAVRLSGRRFGRVPQLEQLLGRSPSLDQEETP
jgi:nitroimidazol reductase NimA-like FMN-containing flavoprotein (pyridoxamine 5'-phosphate oxidase superfamily)